MKKPAKKQYERPAVKRVKLDAEVILTANCKVLGQIAGSKTGRQCNDAACKNSTAGS